MEKIFNVNDKTGTLYIESDELTEDQVFNICKNKDSLKDAILLESGIAPADLEFEDGTTIKKGNYFCKLAYSDMDIFDKIQEGGLQMIMKSIDDNCNTSIDNAARAIEEITKQYKEHNEQSNYQMPDSSLNGPRIDYWKIVKYAPNGTQSTLMDLVRQANSTPTEEVTIDKPSAHTIKYIDTLSKAQYKFKEKLNNGAEQEHTDNLLNYGYEGDTKRATVMFSPYLGMME